MIAHARDQRRMEGPRGRTLGVDGEPRAFLAVGCGLSKVAGWGSFEDEGVVDPWKGGCWPVLLLGEARSRRKKEPTPHLFFQLNLLLVLRVPRRKGNL